MVCKGPCKETGDVESLMNHLSTEAKEKRKDENEIIQEATLQDENEFMDNPFYVVEYYNQVWHVEKSDISEDYKTSDSSIQSTVGKEQYRGESLSNTMEADMVNSEHENNLEYNEWCVRDDEEEDTLDATRAMHLQHQMEDKERKEAQRRYKSRSRCKKKMKQYFPAVDDSRRLIHRIKSKLLQFMVKRRSDKAAKKVIHRHTFTCLHGKHGKKCCRMAYKRAFALWTKFTEVEKCRKQPRHLVMAEHEYFDCEATITKRNLDMNENDALPEKQTTVILFDQRRPTKDDQMVVYNLFY